MNFVIIGGGPTGVEMAGAIAEISRTHVGQRFSPHRSVAGAGHSHRRRAASAGCLIPPDLSESARKQLADLGVDVRTSTRATNLTEAGVQIGDEFIPCRVKIWAAGNNASFVGKTLGVPTDRVGRVVVNDDLTHSRAPGSPGDWRPGEFCASDWTAFAGRLASGDATGAPCSAQRPGNDYKGVNRNDSVIGTREPWRRSGETKRSPI